MKGNTKKGARKGIKTKIERYGRDIFRQWGTKGGNPLLLAQGIENRSKPKEEKGKGILALIKAKLYPA